MAINTIDNFSYKGKKFLDDRTSFKTTQEMNDVDPNTIPRGFKGFDEEAGVWKMWIEDEHGDLSWRVDGTGSASSASSTTIIVTGICRRLAMKFCELRRSGEMYRNL